MLSVLDRRLLVVSGKGGVGKTMISAALARLAARGGKKVLLVNMEGQGRTAQLFGVDEITAEPRPLADGVWGALLDPKAVAFQFILRQLRVRRLVRHIVESNLFDAWFRVSPAIKEMICLGRVWSFTEDKSRWRKTPRWDLVVFDAPATGHGLGLLQLPEQASKLLLGPMRKHAVEVQAMLEDRERTGTVLVTLPEDLPVNEALHFHRELTGRLGMQLDLLVMNMAFPDRFDGEAPDLEQLLGSTAGRRSLERLLGSGCDREAAVAAVRASVARGERTRRYALELAEGTGQDVVQVPFVYAERFGLEELRVVEATLAQRLEGAS